MAVISISYEPETMKYKSVDLYFYKDGKEAEKQFFEKGFVIDWYLAKRFYLTEIMSLDDEISNLVLSASSSVDQFIFDQPEPKYKSAFLLFDQEEPELRYIDSDNSFAQKMQLRRGWEMFVPIDKNWNWLEYKIFCTV